MGKRPWGEKMRRSWIRRRRTNELEDDGSERRMEYFCSFWIAVSCHPRSPLPTTTIISYSLPPIPLASTLSFSSLVFLTKLYPSPSSLCLHSFAFVQSTVAAFSWCLILPICAGFLVKVLGVCLGVTCLYWLWESRCPEVKQVMNVGHHVYCFLCFEKHYRVTEADL